MCSSDPLPLRGDSTPVSGGELPRSSGGAYSPPYKGEGPRSGRGSLTHHVEIALIPAKACLAGGAFSLWYFHLYDPPSQ